jgi:hypothetical protein
MDGLRVIFPGHSESNLERAFLEAGGVLDQAVEIILSSDTQQAGMPGLGLETDRPASVSPASSVDSFSSLRISDDDDDGDGNGAGVIYVGNGLRAQQGRPVAISQDDVLQGLLNIFPDVCLTYITELYQEHRLLQGDNITEFIANKLVETNYPRAKPVEKVGQKRKRADEEGGGKPDYESDDRPPGTVEYRGLVYVIRSLPPFHNHVFLPGED